MYTERLRQILCFVTLAIVLVVNYLANALPLGGNPTGELARSFDVLFLPAGYVFSIWGLIYLLLIAFTVFQAQLRHRYDRELDRIGTAFCYTNVANVLWLVFFHSELVILSLVAMIALLGLLIYIAVRLQISEQRGPGPRLWFVHVPFDIYLGWISVATVANATQVLSEAGLSGVILGDIGWTIVAFAAVVALSLFMSFRFSNIPHAAVLVWALVGIAVEQEGIPAVVWGASVSAVVIIAGLLIALLVKQNSPDVVV